MQDETQTPSYDDAAPTNNSLSDDPLGVGAQEDAASAAAAELAAAQVALRQQGAAARSAGASSGPSRSDSDVADPPDDAPGSSEASTASAPDEASKPDDRPAPATQAGRGSERVNREEPRPDTARDDLPDDGAQDDNARDDAARSELRRAEARKDSSPDAAPEELEDTSARDEVRDDVLQEETRRDAEREDSEPDPTRERARVDGGRDVAARPPEQPPASEQHTTPERPWEAQDRAQAPAASAVQPVDRPRDDHESGRTGADAPPPQDPRENRAPDTHPTPDRPPADSNDGRNPDSQPAPGSVPHPANHMDPTPHEQDQRQPPVRQAGEANDSTDSTRGREAEARERDQAQARREQADALAGEHADARERQMEDRAVTEPEANPEPFETLERDEADAHEEQRAARAKARELDSEALHEQAEADARALAIEAEHETEQRQMDAILGDQLGPLPPSLQNQAHDELTASREAFAGRFAETDALRDLWERAAADRSSFPSAREEFWRLVNNDSSPDAQAVRELLHVAGFETHTGTANAPTLHVEGYEAVRAEDANRVRADLTLSIDHIDAQAHGGERLKASNLRFLSTRDNSTRGARHDASDRLIDAEYDEAGNRISPFPEMSNEDQRERELFRERVQALLGERQRHREGQGGQ
jgi:hypothetical protein